MGSVKSAELFRKIPTFLIFASICLCSLQSGGLVWQYSIVPILLLCLAAVLNKFKSSGIVTDILVFMSLVACAISVFLTKSDMQDAIHESIKYIGFVAAFYASVSIPKKSIYKVLSVVGVFIAVSGLLAYGNIIRLSELVFNDRGILRLQSFIKYANTTSVFLGCVYFCLCGIKIKNQKLSGMLKMLVLSAFYLTVSKAAIPIFLCIGILYTIKKQDSDFLVHNAVCFLFVIPAIYLSGRKMFSQCILLIIIWITVGSLLSGKFKYSRKFSSICVLGAIVAVAAASYLMISGKYDIFSTFTYRLKYMKDAAKLLNSGLFGNGPASWKLMQFGVQTEQYGVTYIHNSWLQFLVENGLIFFVTLTSVVIISAYRMYKSKSWETLAAVVFISVHSLIDINFGFTILLIIFGVLCGCESKPSSSKHLTVATLIICLTAMGYGCADYYARFSFEKSYTAGYNALALKKAYILEKLCPGDSSVQVNIMSLSNDYVEERLEKAMMLSPYDRNYVIRYAQHLISQNKKEVLEVLEKLIDMAPMQEDTYVSVKQLAEQALTQMAITEEEYKSFIKNTDSVMNQNGVIDRNKQLENISK